MLICPVSGTNQIRNSRDDSSRKRFRNSTANVFYPKKKLERCIAEAQLGDILISCRESCMLFNFRI